jgi:hypothetical protein
MTQARRDNQLAMEIGGRLRTLLADHLHMTPADVSRALGYKNDTVIRRAQDGGTCLSASKLRALANIGPRSGEGRVSVDWLLTGEGMPLRPSLDWRTAEDPLYVRINRASVSAREAISAYLDVSQAAVSQPTVPKS